ncbi:DUF6114 domain-containing protein [Lacisediminihabitans sp.]|uniref:DUF6114 domain-containing protein n=1 Tax=Lacisediminihabitans sp. TaxID=2787631 RepID=UPI00374D6047
MSTDRRAKSQTARPRDASAAGTRFGRWYRSRPLIGGILIVLAGLEMFFSGQLDFGSIHIQVGIEGMQAMILPFALVTLGVLIVAMPAHRIFYGVMSLAIAIYGVVGVNLGGFLIGTLLGVVGGIMCVSWAPPRAPAKQSDEPTGDEGADLEADSATEPASEPPPFSPAPAASGAASVTVSSGGSEGSGGSGVPGGPADTARVTGSWRRGGTLAVVAVMLLAGASATTLAVPSFADTAVANPDQTAVPTDATPSAAPSPVTSPGPPSPVPSPSAPSPSPSAPSTPVSPPAPVVPRPVTPRAAASAAPAPDAPRDPDAPLSASSTARLRGTSVALSGGRYAGTVTVALAGGGSTTVLKITADSVSIGGFALDSTDPATRMVAASATTLILGGPVTIYCRSLSGTLAGGSPVDFDPKSPPPVGAALPSLENATIALVAVTGAAATLAGTVETAR